MSNPIIHIEKIEREIHALNRGKHIITSDEYVAMKDLQDSLHALRKCFEYYKTEHKSNVNVSGKTAGEIIDEDNTIERPDND